MLMLLLVPSGQAATLNREYPLKVAYLFHLAELTEWPAPANIKICLLGDSPIREYLPALAGQAVNGGAVQISINQGMEGAECNIIFLANNAGLTPELSARAINQHILLVSDMEGFAALGGMVEIALRDNKLKLVISLEVVKKAGLKLSSKLLRMAEILE
ncbi:YfiR family protein [Methylomonas paludis]|uniref:YfiR family protein n=2 Tax=Methylomonas paludis TaxID=1173101 RepID=A0A975MNF7_9GAMM|nr:YfiR family protein [Methylomonas paludis]